MIPQICLHIYCVEYSNIEFSCRPGSQSFGCAKVVVQLALISSRYSAYTARRMKRTLVRFPARLLGAEDSAESVVAPSAPGGMSGRGRSLEAMQDLVHRMAAAPASVSAAPLLNAW